LNQDLLWPFASPKKSNIVPFFGLCIGSLHRFPLIL
jgi:hypothetical protein